MKQKLVPAVLRAYSDDLDNICGLFDLVSRDPAAFPSPAKLINSLTRQYITVSIANFEYLLNLWRKKNPALKKTTDQYLKDRLPNGRPAGHNDRTKALFEAFNKNGLKVNKVMLGDFLALKYLRNIIISSAKSTSEDKRKYISSKRFPANINGFSKDDLLRINKLHIQMMDYAFTLTRKLGFDFHQPKPEKMTPKYVLHDIRSIYGTLWKNIENSLTLFTRDIQKECKKYRRASDVAAVPNGVFYRMSKKYGRQVPLIIRSWQRIFDSFISETGIPDFKTEDLEKVISCRSVKQNQADANNTAAPGPVDKEIAAKAANISRSCKEYFPSNSAYNLFNGIIRKLNIKDREAVDAICKETYLIHKLNTVNHTVNNTAKSLDSVLKKLEKQHSHFFD